MKKVLLLTGVSGPLGEQIIQGLKGDIEKVYILLRKGRMGRARKLLALCPHAQIIEGDLQNPSIITKKEDLYKVTSQVNIIFHGSNYFDLEGSYKDCFLRNVTVTQNILSLSLQCQKLKYFHYLSSIAVVGDYQGQISEGDLELGQHFQNNYGKTKYDSELLVRNFPLKGIKKRIYRLGILVGDSIKGNFKKSEGPYTFLKKVSELRTKKLLLNTLKYLPMPYEKSSRLPMIPIDKAGSFLSHGILYPKGRENIRCYHLVSEGTPRVGEFIQDAFDEFGFKVTILPLPKTKINHLIIDKIGISQKILDQTYAGHFFDTKMTKNDYPEVPLGTYIDYKKVLFGRALKKL